MPVTTYTEDDLVDQYDEFEGDDDELSPEDKVAMSEATAAVQQVLGDQVTVAQIQEALWHYYYDVDKSVAYLRRTFISPPKPAPKKVEAPKKPEAAPKKAEAAPKKPEGKSGEFSFSDALGLFVRAGRGRGTGDALRDFDDMPWMNVPRHRLATMVPPPRLGGLLGGGEPKMSKLQALAAARKKKTETAQAESGMKRLSITDTEPSKRQKNWPLPRPPLEQPAQASPAQESETQAAEETLEAQAPAAQTPDAQAPSLTAQSPASRPEFAAPPAPQPSAFARALFGPPPRSRPEVFAMPYASALSAEAFAQPSPDDVVLAAQAKAGKPKKEPAKAKDVAEGVAKLQVDAPPPKSKGLDVVKEFESSDSKRSTSFVVVGHVDAGKSTLMGRLLVELKYVEQRTVDKYRRQAEKSGKQSFALAWVMDQGSEERDRGVTIDIATNHFETERTKFTILDAPGHRDFVPNMIAGASQADFAILVIDANTGAYEKGLKGQTKEHVLLLRSLGVQRLIVAVNKLDMVGWSRDRFNEIAEQVGGFLTGLGFQEKSVTFVPISGLSGDNVGRKIEDPAASWYGGATLMEALEEAVPTSTRALRKPFRMGISEVFRSAQGTATLAGRVDSGTVQVGDSVLVQPSGEAGYVKSIMADTEGREWAVAGQSVTVALTSIDPVHIRVGDILCEAKNPIPCDDTFTMKAMAFEHVMVMPVDLHRGRLHAPGQVQTILATLDKATGAVIKKKPKVVQPGAVARLVIKLAAKVPLEAGQRVVIRSGGETIAAGLLE